MRPVEPRDDDLAHCRMLLAKGSKTFSLAARFLPRDVRADVLALYAFCRVSDDLIDDPTGDANAALRALALRLDRVYAGDPDDDPVDRALSAVVARRSLPRAWLDALLEGYLWDARGRHYESLDDVIAYAARVAGSVGACMARFMGVTDRRVLARACDLGVAMQLTNIARDIREDALRGRVYLPARWLRREGVDANSLVQQTPDARVVTIVEALLLEAEAFYATADVGIARLPARYRRAIRAARRLYAEIGEVIRRRGFDISTRAVVSAWRKAWLALRSMLPFASESDALHGNCHPETLFLIDAVTPRDVSLVDEQRPP